MIRLACLLVLPVLLASCASAKPEKESAERAGYAGTVQKIFKVVRQGKEVPGMRLLGKVGEVLSPRLRHSSETLQYVVRTPSGAQIMAQTDAEFAVGDCVEVVPETEGATGPAFRYGEAQVLRSDSCTENLTPENNALSML